MKREAQIICPSTSELEAGAAKALRRLQAGACKAFGGCTTTTGDGQWIDASGHLVAEPVSIVTIACEDTADNRRELGKLALDVKVTAGQECVYVRFPAGDVELV